ncbi:MAG: hypothetical protein HPY53_07890 [Brevinematales bacterium]|nr:hypothetical protein [Brevinematales bacterium]
MSFNIDVKQYLDVFLLNNVKKVAEMKNTFKERFYRLYCEERDIYRKNSSTFKERSDFFLNLAGKLENILEELINKHSTFFWLQIIRKLRYDFLLNEYRQVETSFFIRKTLDCFIFKYGSDKYDDVGKNNNTLIPLLNDIDILSSIEMVFIAEEYYLLTSGLRRVNKGCRLILNKNRYSTKASEELEFLMNLIDDRNSKYNKILYMFSINAPFFDIINETPSYPLICSGIYIETKEYYSPYSFIFLNTNIFLSYVEFWEEMNIQVYNMNPKHIVCCLCTLTWSRFAFGQDDCGLRQERIISNIKLNGYSIADKNDFITTMKNIFLDIYTMLFKESFAKTEKEKKRKRDLVIEQFMNNCINKEIINPFVRGFLPLLVISNSIIIINWLAVYDILNTWTEKVYQSRKSEIASNRGSLFQEEVRSFVIETFNEKEYKIWENPENIYLNRGISAQVDIGCQKGNVLYIIECKFKMRNSDDEYGYRKSEVIIWNEIKSWIEQVYWPQLIKQFLSLIFPDSHGNKPGIDIPIVL